VLISERISDYFSKNNLENVFMVTGGAAMFLNDSLTRNKNLHTTFFHHEQSCAMAAEAYARIKGIPPILCLTAGPGGINSLNGIFGAFNDSLPVIVLSGQVRTETLNRNEDLRQLGDQEAPITSIVKSITKYSKTITNPNEIDYELNKALHIATTGRPGPVWLDIPINIQSSEYIKQNQKKVTKYPKSKTKQSEFQKLNLLYKQIKKSNRPVILVGSGIRLSNQVDEFFNFIKKFDIPVITGFNGHDLMWEKNPKYVGRAGTIGNRSGNLILECADLLIVLGSRLNIRQIGYNYNSFGKNKFFCYVDIDKAELNKPTLKNIDLKINVDLIDYFKFFKRKSENKNENHKKFLNWSKRIHNKYGPKFEEFPKVKNVNPYKFTSELSNHLKANDVITFSNATAGIVPNQALELKKGQRFFGSSGSGSMGFGIPSSIGASLASKHRVICFEGDGSIQMNIQELATIYHNKLNIKIFIFSNNGYHSIRQTQENYFKDNLVGLDNATGLSFPDYKIISAAYGIDYLRINSHKDTKDNLEIILNNKRPVICEVVLDKNINYQPKVSSKKDASGKIVSANLYDMSPFLDKDELEKILSIKK
jgi:acetolactate synthase I/II/III large subunit